MNNIWMASLLSMSILLGCSNDDSTNTDNTMHKAADKTIDQTINQTMQSKTDKMDFLTNTPKQGSALPFSVLRDDLIDAKTQKSFQIRNGGFGSAMTANPGHPNQFYALTDRGPNANYTGDYGTGKSFPVADYIPRIGLFEVAANGEVSQLKTILLKRPDGNDISGLPNSSALGGTGETPYHANGQPVLVDDTQAYNAISNPIKLDDYGLDGEGLVALKDGTFWVSDEYGPHMVHFDKNGVEIERINAFANDERTKFNLPAVFQHRRANRGMEGLAITPDETTLVGIMQSTLTNPDKNAQKSDLTRIVTIDVNTGDTQQFLYRQEKAQNSNSEIATLSADKFLVIERDGSFLLGGPATANPNAQKQVYRIDLTTGTNLSTIELSDTIIHDESHGLMIDGLTLEQYAITNGWDALAEKGIKPVSKTLVVDMVKEVAYPHDKMEGLWVIDQQHLGVLNDDDFATWSTGGKLEQKYLNDEKVDSNLLYIIKADLMKP